MLTHGTQARIIQNAPLKKWRGQMRSKMAVTCTKSARMYLDNSITQRSGQRIKSVFRQTCVLHRSFDWISKKMYKILCMVHANEPV